MLTVSKVPVDVNDSPPSEFTVQLYAQDGQLLSEYTLNRRGNNVHTLGAAERCARERVANQYGEPLIVIVSEETLTKLRQVQIRVAANDG